jgi:hypothetical protein
LGVGALAQAIPGVRGQVLTAVAVARGPCDNDAVDLLGRSHAEVKAVVARREIASAANPRGHLLFPRGSHGQPYSHGVTIRWAGSVAVDDSRLLGYVDEPAGVVAKDVIRARGQQASPMPIATINRRRRTVFRRPSRLGARLLPSPV